MPFIVRALTHDEWEIFRDLRHRSLGDSPDAFRPTEGETLSIPDDEWKDIVASTTTSPYGLLVVAEHQREPVGTAFGRIDDDGHSVHVGAMWVDPTARGLGIGRALLDACLDWGTNAGATRVSLWVVDDNSPALALYESAGFERTGEKDVLREGSTIPIVGMTRDL